MDDLGNQRAPLRTISQASPCVREGLGQTAKAFVSAVRPGMHTVETGAGFLSLPFIIRGARHTAICPDSYAEANIRKYCDARRIDHSRFTYICARPQDVVPHLEDVFDFAFIAGAPAIYTPIVSFYFLARRLKVGGHMAIANDGAWMADIIAKQLALDSDWKLVAGHCRGTSIFRLEAPFRDKDCAQLAVRNTAYPVARPA